MTKNIIIIILTLFIIAGTYVSFINKKDSITREFISVPKYIDKPIPHLVLLPFLDTIHKIDTVFIIKDYYSKKYYTEELKLPHNSNIKLNFMSYKNEVDSLSFTYYIKYPKFKSNVVGVVFKLGTPIKGMYYQKDIKSLNLGITVYEDKSLTLNLGWRF